MFLSSSLPHLRLLLVEDDEDDYIITRDLLDEIAPDQYDLDWVRSASEARPALASDAHHVCLLDYRLGPDDGLTLLEEARSLGFSAPIIMLTGQDDREVDHRALRAGAADYLVKSQLTSAGLARAVRYAVARHETERERSERHRAEAENRSKSEFLAHLSHELRTPLTAILGYTDLMLSSDPTTESRARLEIVKRNGSHLLGLLNDVLDLSKIEAGRLEIESQEVDLQRLVADVHSLLVGSAVDKNLELNMTQKGDLPTVIRTDPLRYRQILINLISNAIKFTDVGKVEVELSVAEAEGGRVLLQAAVRDTGIGISPRDLRKLFAPFTQLKAKDGPMRGGTGLGLAISKRLSERLGGDIVAQSDPGRGSTFIVTIDPGDLDGVPFGTLAPQSEIDPGHEMRRPSVSGRVLVADDLPDIRELVGYMVRRAGADVDYASDGEDAVAKIEEAAASDRPYDLVLMDVQMPRMSGLEATAHLRSLGFEMPILALTAATMSGERERCLDAGYDEHLSKPIDERLLLRFIRRHLRRRPAEASGGETPARSSGKRLSVLLVEDDPDARNATAEILRLLGCDVATAGSASEARACAQRGSPAPDVALVDLTLPDDDGYELVRALKTAGMDETRFITLSGREADTRQATEVGVERHLEKPVGLAALKTLLEQVGG
ncbi:MAG: response regulator [Candidatus Eisenbacteria bacterium]|uniref:histidine kinase n=1 Tax=Eiseniibacteriota bacterium TaxID=2212470 RepID=A0A956NE34_UNCEI|nr:response regulator [Candidatus Eisenbacteria bacterium]MCB9465516.1 response regulator [Candidatus Eisenbacteria bacterium]